MTATETRPETRIVKPITFLYFRTETYLHQLENLVPVARDLHKEAAAYDLHVTGPLQWHYFGFLGDASKPFTLEISLPVAEAVKEYDGSFHFKRTEPFKCISLVHEGAWTSLGEAYASTMKFAAEQGLEPNGINREVYINADFEVPDANITQVLVGIK